MNYYELLKIERGADSNEIKRAYFSAVKIHSPDSDPEGFKALRIAYETLYDPKKRAEYDAYFTASDEIQNDLLAARELIRENKYKQALEFLTELSGKNPDSTDVKRLLATVLWYMKKSGTANKMCGELLEKNPADCDTLLLRAKIAASMGHVDKADGYFDSAVNAAPLNTQAWIDYMHYSMVNARWQVSKVFFRAMEQNPDMFCDEYILYLVGVHGLDLDSDLFEDKNYLQYYDKFAEYFFNDKNPDEAIYSQVLRLIPHFIEDDQLIPFVEKIVPALKNSRQYRDEDEEEFKYIHAVMVMHKLRSDKRIHDVLVDLTGLLLDEDEEDKEDRLEMEIYIVFNLSLTRPSIKLLLNEYPEYFKLNQAFYLDALNEKKTDFLMDKYAGIYKRLRASAKDDDEYFGDFKTGERIETVRREAPKIGRNDPCPCGSGKKYKKCCG